MSASPRILPGFRITLTATLIYTLIIVLIPLSAAFFKTFTMTWPEFWQAVSSPRVIASYKVSFGTAAVATLVNVIFGGLIAWVLVRYSFPGRRFIDALVDLPFALPTAVAGIALTAIYAPNGWIGKHIQPVSEKVQKHYADMQPTDGLALYLAENGLKVAFSPVGITIALIFIGLPFVIRTVQPILQEMDPGLEQAAATLGANRWQTITRIILPELWPALLAGAAMSFARGLGEYGSVVFISGNMPMKTEITPLLIVTKLEQYDYKGATALAVVMLIISFAMLLVINSLQGRLNLRAKMKD
ncbi:MAG TPA: sulfate ABC transporter permease subunit CysT [Chthoniobacterales bacterium]|jgi:sulfate transport system permease protein